MNNSKAVYRILSFLKCAEKYAEFDSEDFDAGYFKLTDKQWANTLERLTDDGYIKGVKVRTGADGYTVVSIPNPRITSAGLDYLENNPTMQSVSAELKGKRG